MMSPQNSWNRTVSFWCTMIFALAWSGCQSSIKMAPDDFLTEDSEMAALDTEAPAATLMVQDPLKLSPHADLERATEVKLVEQMATYRSRYQQQLNLLIQFYDRQGNQLKTSWASQELSALQHGPQRSYLVVAEVAGSDLHASDDILEANLIYREGLELFKQGRGNFGKLFTDKKKLYQARDKFNELITDYPTSHRIDDAAFQIGEIYNHYLKDYTTALLYYQRVWQWDTETTLPVRFWVAKIYDEQLRDRAKAIEYYQQAIELETSYPNNLNAAKNRIQQLTKE